MFCESVLDSIPCTETYECSVSRFYARRLTRKNCLLALSCLSVHLSAYISLAPTSKIFVKSYVRAFYLQNCRKIQICLKSEKMSNNLQENLKYVVWLPVT
jgi:hypothetical protein